MSHQIFTHTHRVTYAECTIGNHVYYARYLDLLETARGEFFRALGMTFQQLHDNGTVFPATWNPWESRLATRRGRAFFASAGSRRTTASFDTRPLAATKSDATLNVVAR